MITWEEGYGAGFRDFIEEICETNPDFIVPVTRKSAKLFRSIKTGPRILKKIFYRQYFDYMNIQLDGKTIVVVDNTVEEATTLKRYRQFFESRGAENVRTFAFIAHEDLGNGKKMPLDRKMEKPSRTLTEAAYREYLLIESNHLISQGFEQDIDHLVLEINLDLNGADFQKTSQSLYSVLGKEGFAYFVPPFFDDPIRISLDSPEFFPRFSSLHPSRSFFAGINKIRFHLGSDCPLLCIPMVFPRVRLSMKEEFLNQEFPFLMPIQEAVSRDGSFSQQLYYCSVSLLLSAELGRTLLCFLKNDSADDSIFDSRDFSVNFIDFQRYFGNNLGNKIARSIKKFVKEEEFNPGAELRKTISKVADCRAQKKTDGSFSREKANIVIEYLKEEYEKRKMKEKKAGETHFYLSLSEMKKLSGCSYFNLTQLIDSACDKGVLVPGIRKKRQWLERVWRTGETKERAWDRTIRLIPFAIEVMSTKLGEPHPRVGKMLLNKALVNFAWDYPSYKRLIHSLGQEPEMFGPVSIVENDSKLKGKTGIQNHKCLGDRYYLEEGLKKGKKYFYSREGSVEDFTEYVNDETVTLSYGATYAYFSMLTEIYRLFGEKGEGKVDVLTALAICRDFNAFLEQIHFHFNIWKQYFRVFLEDLERSPGEATLDYLGECRTSAKQGFKKIRMFDMFEKMRTKIQKKFMKSLEYKTVLPVILKRQPSPKSNILHLIREIFVIQRALGALLTACFFPEKCKRRSPKEMISWSEKLLEVHGKRKISHDYRENNEKLFKFLKLWDQALQGMMGSIPKARIGFREEREGAFYIDSAINIAEYCAKENNWERVVTLELDLRDSRKYKDQAKIALMHQIADEIAGRNNLYRITHDYSNDFATFSAEDATRVLYTASEIQIRARESNLEIHMGIACSSLGKNGTRKDTVGALALCSELCNYDKEGVRNCHEIFIDERSVELLKNDFREFERYCERVMNASIDGLQVFRLLYEIFQEEYPVPGNLLETSLDRWLPHVEDEV